MRSIGIASRSLDLLLQRVSDPIRKTFGKELREHGESLITALPYFTRTVLISGTVLADIARSRAEIDQARLLVLSAARRVDIVGAKGAMKEIGVSKVRISLTSGLIVVLCARDGIAYSRPRDAGSRSRGDMPGYAFGLFLRIAADIEVC